MRLTGPLVLLAALAGCPAPQPATGPETTGGTGPAGARAAEDADPSDADSESGEAADENGEPTADDREPTADDREPTPEPAESAPEPTPRRARCSVPDPPAGAGRQCPGVRRRWTNIPSGHLRCRADSDCVAVAAGQCRHVGLNTRAARRGRYRVPVCAGPGEGACGGGAPQVRCEAGCCEALPAGLGGFF